MCMRAGWHSRLRTHVLIHCTLRYYGYPCIIEYIRKTIYPKGPGTPGPPKRINYYALGTGGLDYLGICTLPACWSKTLKPCPRTASSFTAVQSYLPSAVSSLKKYVSSYLASAGGFHVLSPIRTTRRTGNISKSRGSDSGSAWAT